MKEMRKGQALLEMALVLPLFLIILIAVADVCFLTLQQYQLDLATADVARWGTQQLARPNPSDLRDKTVHLLNDLPIAQLDDDISQNPDGTGTCPQWRGCYYTVHIAVPVRLLLPVTDLLGFKVPWPGGTDGKGGLLLQSKATFRSDLYRVMEER